MSVRVLATTFAVIGGGLGGIAAALTAARLGVPVVMTEASDWIGGQLTSQAVPPDEHEWIDQQPISPSYSSLREGIRDHYRRHYPLTDRALHSATLNPGAGFVSRLCHEPRVAHLVLRSMLSPHEASGMLTVLTEHDPVSVERDGERITAVTVRDRRTGADTVITARFFADATELGDLLDLGGLEHVIGAESAGDTGELHAPERADPLDQQAITWCAALELRIGATETVTKPADYERWRLDAPSYWPGPQFSWVDIQPTTLSRRERPVFARDPARAIGSDDLDLWHYRRIVSRAMMRPEWPGTDVTLVNWPQIDYWRRPLLGVSDEESRLARVEARAMTESFIYWLQTEAPRADGGRGYPELQPRGDVVGSTDGLAKEVYVRESRRIRALFTVTEAHIGREMRGDDAGSAIFDDSVGIGYYRIDLHPSTSERNYIDIDCFPFQIPLGALIPRDAVNLIASNKNIGTTHITNGAYRLHPVEWSIGEAGGALVALCVAEDVEPPAVHATPALTADLQRLLSSRLGVTLRWSETIRTRGSRSGPVPTPL